MNRNKLPDSAFADSKARRYPIHNAVHVRAALVQLTFLHNAHEVGLFKSKDYLDEITRRIIEKAEEFGIEIPEKLQKYATERVLFI